MTVRVDVAPPVLEWALLVASDPERLRDRFPVERWLHGQAKPTLRQLQGFADAAGVPFGYLMLPAPPEWSLPVPDFREGIRGAATPSANLIAVIGQAQRRQQWYRDYALDLGAEPLPFVGSAAQATASDAAGDIRRALAFDVTQRRGDRGETRRHLLQAFEALGGLTVATSMVGNNNHRKLDDGEFRGFTLVDDIAPLVFVNTSQTLNGQIFTLAHEFAHVWRGTSGIGDEDLRAAGGSDVERWCNTVASEVLVPPDDLADRYHAVADQPLTEALEGLARRYRCGTLVVLQALHRSRLRHFEDFSAVYDAEVARLQQLSAATPGRGGDYYRSQPLRIGERLSRALIADALEGRTPLTEAMRLMSFSSLHTFDEYARKLGAA